MRRTPEATPASEIILKLPISAVLLTWVPPHSSIETLGKSITRTCSPYFSPNIATAPLALASAKGNTSMLAGCASAIQVFTCSSIC